MSLLGLMAGGSQVRAQLGPLPGLPAALLGQPNGVAPLDANARASGLVVLPSGAAAPRSLAARLGDVLSPLDIGAACDETTDDSVVLGAAIAAGRSIRLPPSLLCNAPSLSAVTLANSQFYGGGGVKSAGGGTYTSPSVSATARLANAAIPSASLGQPGGPARLSPAGGLILSGPAVLGTLTAASVTTPAVIDVRDPAYGAKCDGTTDDSAAFNAAFNAARTRLTGGQVTTVVSWHGCSAVIGSTINATGFQSADLTVDAEGSLLLGQTKGKPVIDAMHTKTVKWRGVTIFGQPGAEPNVGFQLGRIATTDASDGNVLANFNLYGAYSFAALYNFGSEILHAPKLTINNTFAGNGTSCFGLVQDGINHWNVQSSFVAETVTPDTFLSFDLDLFDSPNITTAAGCTPLWTGAANGHKYLSGYLANFSSPVPTAGAGYEVILWNPVGYANTMLDFDNFHMETYPTDIFYVTGPNTAPVIRGMRYEESAVQATNSIFKLDPAIASATITDLDLRISAVVVPGMRVFDVPAQWTVTGSVRLGQSGHWGSGPATFNGWLDQAGSTSLTTASVQGNQVISGGSLVAAAFSTGLDPMNGGINLGLAAGTGTPYVDFYGISGMRLIGDAANRLTVQSRALGSAVASFQAATTGNSVQVNGSLQVSGTMTESVGATPASSSAPCSAGQHAWDQNFEYRCVATNTWRRAALGSF